MDEKQEKQFQAKSNCKHCYGRGFVTITQPTGRKKMTKSTAMCHCVTEISPKKRESIISDEEVVVPTVNKDGEKAYASMTVPMSKKVLVVE